MQLHTSQIVLHLAVCPEVCSFLFLEGEKSQQLPPENSNQRSEAARNLQENPEKKIILVVTIYIIS
jgi:hypothetical protein